MLAAMVAQMVLQLQQQVEEHLLTLLIGVLELLLKPELV